MDNKIKEVFITITWSDETGQYRKDFTNLQAFNEFLIKNRHLLETLRDYK